MAGAHRGTVARRHRPCRPQRAGRRQPPSDNDLPGGVMDSTDIAVLTAITVVFTISGLLAIAASLFNWNWFFNTRNARMLLGRYRRRTARCVYFVAGVLILAMVAAIHLRLADKI
ncbi:MAG: hypothetical protein EGQ99_04340 [Porphyromonadaceae bacterium]|nr:hypothetical protein [Porphyromonadaceae bacterium]